jgi:TrmH family RNA methyltransferase
MYECAKLNLMLTKAKIKLIKSLHEKKYRNEYGLFLVEGEKSVKELLQSDFKIEYILSSNEFHEKYLKGINAIVYDTIEKSEIEKVTSLESNDSVLAVVHQKENTPLTVASDEIVLVLDDIRDPGNLGTIIRIADWYGIKKIVASESTVDMYNNKTISASKGSFTRVQMFYTDLEKYLENTKVPILGTFMKGENVHTFDFPKGGILAMGNESNGISKGVEKYITSKITIPSFGDTESLNVSIATAVVVDNWRRGLN